MNTEVEEEIKNSCAGRPIKSSMHHFSPDFYEGCKKFAELSRSSESFQDAIIFNTSCIINATCFLEAKLNEDISVAVICFDEQDQEGRAWNALKNLQRKLSIQEKWDQIALLKDGVMWDRSREPFQSVETIFSLRNELVHYKGSFYEKDEAPNRKIEALMKNLGISSQATWVEDDCSSWVADLLSSKRLGEWIFNSIVRISQLDLERLTRKA